MAQEDVDTGSDRAKPEPQAAWGFERAARAEEAEGRAEEFQGRLMGWLSGGPPPWWPAIDPEKLHAVADVAGLEATMLSEFGTQLANLLERVKDLEEAAAGSRLTTDRAAVPAAPATACIRRPDP